MTHRRPAAIFAAALVLIGLLTGVSLVYSQDQPAEPTPEATPSPTPDAPPEATPAPTPDAPPEATPAPTSEATPAAPAPAPSRRYFTYAVEIARQVENDNDLLLWGRLPIRLPAHTLAARIGYQHRRIDSVYESNGELSESIADFDVPDPFGSGNEFLTAEPSLHGRIHRLNLEASYGITDAVTFYSRLPMQREELTFDINFTAGASADIGIRSTEDFFRSLEHLGRPAPKHNYRSKTFEIGDAEAGVAWNYLHSPYAYLTAAGRVFFPTGRLADPNAALIYGLGPQIDVGRGSYAVGVTHRVDYFLPLRERWIGLVLETNYDYVFQGQRRVPHFLAPDPTFYSQLSEIGVDPRYFPDLSDVGDYYLVTPGSQFDYLAGVSFRFRYFGVGAGFTCEWDEKPRIHGDPEVRELLDVTNAYPSRTRMAVVGEVGVPLSLVYVPGILGFDFRYPVSGRSVLREDINFSVQLQLLLPL